MIFCITHSIQAAPTLGSSVLQCQAGAVASCESGCDEENPGWIKAIRPFQRGSSRCWLVTIAQLSQLSVSVELKPWDMEDK